MNENINIKEKKKKDQGGFTSVWRQQETQTKQISQICV